MDNTTGSCNVDECIFWYKAQVDLPEFKIGKPIYWQLSHEYMKTEEDKRLEEQAEIDERNERNQPTKRISAVQMEDCEDEPSRLLRLC